MEYEAIRLRNRKHVRFISWIDMLIAILMIAYFSYKFILSDLNDVTRPPFSPGKWRGFAEFLFTSICIVYSTQFFIAFFLLTSTSRSEKLENACVKCQIWICISHFLLTTLATELFILGFNLIRPGATTEQTVTFSIATVICLLKCGFRILAERSVKEYLRDIYSVPGVQFSDSMYFAPRHNHHHHANYSQNFQNICHHHHHCNQHEANSIVDDIDDDQEDQGQDNYPEPEPNSPYHYSSLRNVNRNNYPSYYDYDHDEEFDYYEYDEDQHQHHNHHHHHHNNSRDYRHDNRDRRYQYDIV